MKKSELGAVNRYVLENYLPKIQETNVQTFKAIDDFYNICRKWVEQITKDSLEKFGGRQEEIRIQRGAMLNEWFDYVTEESSGYSPAIQLMVLKSITKDLKPDEGTMPNVLNKAVLAATITNVQDKLTASNDIFINFDKEYRLNLQKKYLSEEKTLDESLNGWIIIPSQEHDPENFKANMEKLMTLSCNSWCTKNSTARSCLKEGDFHIYIENGKPALGINFIGNEIKEFQGEYNNSKIPYKYYNIVTPYINNFKLVSGSKAEYGINHLKDIKMKADELHKKFPNGINNYPAEEIFKEFGIKCKKDKDGMLIISHYDAKIDYNTTIGELGIDENELLKNVKAIEGNATFTDSQATNLKNLQSIGGNAEFNHSRVVNLGSLQSIGGDADFRKSEVANLSNLNSIIGNALFNDSKVTNLCNLQTIGRVALFNDSQVTDLSSLQHIGDWADFKHSKVKDLSSLQHIGGKADFSFSQVTDLSSLYYIGGHADFSFSQVTKIGNLFFIGGSVNIKGSKLTPSDFASVMVKEIDYD